MEQSFLVLRGAPAAIDEELDTVARGMSCGSAQRAEESRIEVGDTRNPVIEDRRAAGDGTASLAKGTTVLSPAGCRAGRERPRRAPRRCRTAKDVDG
jgi:hypothetical protein